MASSLADPSPWLSGLSAFDPVQAVSLLGAVMQLVAYALLQLGRLPSTSYPYQLANVLGSLLMTIVASVNHEYGFILMEAVWCLTSAYGLIKLMRSRPDAAGSP
jgi:hypothetical protein